MKIWKDVLGFEGDYLVSNDGDVYSVVSQRNLTPSITRDRYQIRLSKNGKTVAKYVHILVYEAFKGKPKYQVDHINNNPLDNRIENLQDITHRQNLIKDKKPLSGFTGVTKCGNKWGVRIRINGKQHHIGTAKTPQEAHQLYKNKLQQLQN